MAIKVNLSFKENSIDDVINFTSEKNSIRSELPYDIDGIVIKLNECIQHNYLKQMKTVFAATCFQTAFFIQFLVDDQIPLCCE